MATNSQPKINSPIRRLPVGQVAPRRYPPRLFFLQESRLDRILEEPEDQLSAWTATDATDTYTELPTR